MCSDRPGRPRIRVQDKHCQAGGASARVPTLPTSMLRRGPTGGVRVVKNRARVRVVLDSSDRARSEDGAPWATPARTLAQDNPHLTAPPFPPLAPYRHLPVHHQAPEHAPRNSSSGAEAPGSPPAACGLTARRRITAPAVGDSESSGRSGGGRKHSRRMGGGGAGGPRSAPAPMPPAALPMPLTLAGCWW